MRQWMLTGILMLACAGSVAAGEGAKMSMWLRGVVADAAHNPRRAAEQQTMLTTVFVRTDGELSDATLTALGARRYAQLGDIAIVTVPVGQLEALAALQAVSRVEASEPAHVTMDVVPSVSNVTPVYESTDRHQAFTGDGVVMGVMDVGFDLTHPNFYNDATLSRYRIKAFWDQLAQGGDRERLPVGRDFTTAEAILAQGSATDGYTENHGTHTSGTAAGSGYDSPYRGVAFDSDIALVANAVTDDTAYVAREDLYLYTSATDALGFKYLFDYAAAQGKPCVASFSEGYTPYMDHDDQLYGDFIERLTGPGRIVVASAGNEGSALTYVDKPVGKSEAGAYLRVYRPNARYQVRADGDVSLALLAYEADGTPISTLRLATDQARGGSAVADTLFVETDTCAVVLTCYDMAFTEGQSVYQLELRGNRNLSDMARIALVVGNADCHAEIFGSGSSQLTFRDNDSRWTDATSGHNVLAPGCFPAVIAVGSTTHRVGFTNAQGIVIKDEHSADKGGLSYFSSTGPTMDGRVKPDVTAPGVFVISSLSSYHLENPSCYTYWDVKYFEALGRKYVWGAYSGTSMSAPVVAGVIALWLQAKPDLTRDDILGVLSRTCRHPQPELDYPNNRYGYGDIDAHAGLLDILGLTAVEAISQHQPQRCRLWAADGQLHLCFDARPAEPVTVSVYAADGGLRHQRVLTPADRELTVALPPLPGGVYAVQLTSNEKGVTGSQLVRL